MLQLELEGYKCNIGGPLKRTRIKETRKEDPTIALLKSIRQTNDRQMGAVLPVRAFVELNEFGYVSGTSSATYLTANGIKAIVEDGK